MNKEKRTCPICSSKKLIEGSIGAGFVGFHFRTFKPSDRFMFAGYDISGFMCLTCGFILNFVDVDDVKRESVWREQNQD